MSLYGQCVLFRLVDRAEKDKVSSFFNFCSWRKLDDVPMDDVFLGRRNQHRLVKPK